MFQWKVSNSLTLTTAAFSGLVTQMEIRKWLHVPQSFPFFALPVKDVWEGDNVFVQILLMTYANIQKNNSIVRPVRINAYREIIHQNEKTFATMHPFRRCRLAVEI